MVPSTAPTCIPTLMPTARPTMIPTLSPSNVPTLRPTARPTIIPSTAPSRAPTVNPSRNPTMVPTVSPTRAPTVRPTVRPTTIPTIKPTNHPSASPTLIPTAIPTIRPSCAPSRNPTIKPTGKPSYAPTTPGEQVNFNTSLSLAGLTPSEIWASPAVQTAIIDSTLYAMTDSKDSKLRGTITQVRSVSRRRLSGNRRFSLLAVSEVVVTVGLTMEDFVFSSMDNAFSELTGNLVDKWATGSFLTTLKSNIVANDPQMSTKVDSLAQVSTSFDQPVKYFTVEEPTAIPTPSPGPTRAPSTASPTLYRFAPTILTQTLSSTKTTITLNLQFSPVATYPGIIYCSAFPSGTNSVTINQVVSSAATVNYLVGAFSGTITIRNLKESERYNTFCYIKNTLGFDNSVSEVTATRKVQDTACCRTISFTNAPAVVFGDTTQYTSSQTSRFQFTYLLSSAPSSTVVISPTLYTLDGTAVSASLIAVLPGSTTFTTSRTGSFILSGDTYSEGNYVIRMLRSGASAAEYDDASVSVTIIASFTPAPPPKLQAARFEDSGASLFISFDSSTDRARITAQTWNCNSLFSYLGSRTSTCFWLNSTTVRAAFGTYSSAEHLVEVGDIVSLRPNLLRAVCASGAPCDTYNTSAAQNTTVLTPLNPLVPVAILNVPSSINSCDNVTIDATASVGRVGRDWSAVTWQVTAQGASATIIETLLSARGVDLTRTISLGPRLFTTATYVISLTVTNYFGRSSSTTVMVTKGTNPNMPFLTILGASYLSIKPNQAVTVRSTTSFAVCADKLTIKYDWTVSLNGVKVNVAQGRDPTALSLAPNTLVAGNIYNVLLTASVPAFGINPAAQAAGTMQIQVQAGAIVPIVRGGTTRRVFIEDFVVIDGSQSYDENFGTAAKSSLSYQWTCAFQNSADFGTSCNSVFLGVSTTNNVLAVAGQLLLQSKIYGFTLTATAPDGRFGTITVSVEQLTGNSASASIVTTRTRVNSNTPLTINGVVTANFSVLATWQAAVEGTSVSLNALTPMTKVFSKAEAAKGILFPLSFPANVLTQGTSVTFRLSAIFSAAINPNLASVCEIIVTVNSAPTGGKITITPPSGNALQTIFSIISSEWSDVDLPLTYEFSQLISATRPPLSIRTRSSSNVADTELSEGIQSSGYVVTIINNIYDNSLAFTRVTSSAVVQKLVEINPISYFATKSEEFLATGDTSKATAALNNVAVTVNRVNCTLAPPTFCASLNRDPCELTAQRCSSCLPGFTGRSGSANSLCFNTSATSDIRNIGAPCTLNSQCLLGACEAGVCVAPYKLCPTASSTEVCSGHGSCVYSVVKSTPCTVLDTRCTASCQCMNGYGGNDCSLNPEEKSTRDTTRKTMCDYILVLGQTVEHSSQLLDTLVGSLLVAYDPSEVVTPDSVLSCQTALSYVTGLAAQGYLNNALPSTKVFIVNLLSKFTTIPTTNSTANATVASSNSDLVNDASSNVARAFIGSMADGQEAQTIVSDNARYMFRRDLASEMIDTTVAPPLTDEEAEYNTPSSGIQLLGPAIAACTNGAGYIGLSLMQWGTNPFRKLNGSQVGSAQLKFDNFATTGNNNNVTVDNTTIAYYIINQFNEPQNFDFNISLEAALSANLPNFTFPDCTLFDGKKYVPCEGCQVSSYTNYNVTFKCFDPFQLCGGRKSTQRLLREYSRLAMWDQPRRFLQGDDDDTNVEGFGSDSIQYAALFEAIGQQVTSTLSRNPFAVDWAKASAIVTFVGIFLFSILAGYIIFARWDHLDRGFLVYAKNETDKARIKLRHAYMLQMQTQEEAINKSALDSESSLTKAKKMFRISETTYQILQEAFEKEHQDRMNVKKRINGALSRFLHGYGFEYDLRTGNVEDAGETPSGRPLLKKDKSTSEHLFRMFSDEETQRHLEYNAVFEEDDNMETKDELYIANVVADFLNSVMPEGSVAVGNKRFSAFMHRMLKEHDYTAMFYDPSLKYPRSLRWLNVCVQLLINLFVDTIFFGIFYPDSGICEANTTEEMCIIPQNAVMDAPMCTWLEGDEETAPLCFLTSPPNGFVFLCVLVCLTQLVGLPLAFFYDFVLKEFCTRRPDLERWGLDTMYYLGRSTQNRHHGATQEATESRLKDVFNEVDEARKKAREADIANFVVSKQV